MAVLSADVIRSHFAASLLATITSPKVQDAEPTTEALFHKSMRSVIVFNPVATAPQVLDAAPNFSTCFPPTE